MIAVNNRYADSLTCNVALQLVISGQNICVVGARITIIVHNQKSRCIPIDLARRSVLIGVTRSGKSNMTVEDALHFQQVLE